MGRPERAHARYAVLFIAMSARYRAPRFTRLCTHRNAALIRAERAFIRPGDLLLAVISEETCRFRLIRFA